MMNLTHDQRNKIKKELRESLDYSFFNADVDNSISDNLLMMADKSVVKIKEVV